ncbi:MAG: LysR family transcriptional regulator [Fibrobacteria bacterium]
MEMHQMRYFLLVCETGNFTRAAHAACVSQPSLTQAIGKLEEELGGRLFQRDRGGCSLTELGRILEPGLRNIQDQSLAIRSDAVRFVRLKKRPLRIGLMQTIGARRLAPQLALFQREHPEVEVEIVLKPESDLLARLESDAIDVAVSAPEEPPGKAFALQHLYRERYGVAFPKSHRLAKLKKVTLQDIQREPYLDRLNCELRENLRAVCLQRELPLYATYRSNDEGWILHMVREGMGIALVPEFTLPAGDGDLGFRYFEDPPLHRDVSAIFRAIGRKKAETATLIDFLSRRNPGSP